MLILLFLYLLFLVLFSYFGYLCFLFSLAFSSLFPFSVCVSFSVSSSRSISFSPSTVSISFLTFLLLLGSLFFFDFFSFPLLLFLPSPISLFFSFPVWVFLLSPLVPLSRIFCSLLATLVFPFLPFSHFPQFPSSSFVSVSFPVPSSPLLADSSSCWSVLSPICCVTLRCVSLSRFSPVSLLFLFLCLVCFFSESSSLVPVLVSSTSSSSPFLFP